MKDRFVFYSRSADKKPGQYKGSGWSEHAQNKEIYKELSKIRDWRKQLSNMYICPFRLDNQEWNSVEHFSMQRNIEINILHTTKTFTVNGKKPWSKNPFKSKQAGKLDVCQSPVKYIEIKN